MTPLEFLSRFSDPRGLSRRSVVIALAFYLRQEAGTPQFTSSDMRACFRDALQKPPANLPALLRSLTRGKTAPLLVFPRRGRFSLSIYGLREVEDALAPKTTSPENLGAFLGAALPYLQRLVAKVADENRRKFLAEAIACLGVQAKRATVIMTWLVAIDHLYNYILANKLSDFNAALARCRGPLSGYSVRAKDDFAGIKDSVLLEVCRSANIISNDVRRILDEKLGIRNSCAHPSIIEIHDTKVVNFIEDLVDNLIVKYPC